MLSIKENLQVRALPPNYRERPSDREDHRAAKGDTGIYCCSAPSWKIYRRCARERVARARSIRLTAAMSFLRQFISRGSLSDHENCAKMFNEAALNRIDASTSRMKWYNIAWKKTRAIRCNSTWLNDTAHVASGMTKYAFNVARDIGIHYAAQCYLEYLPAAIISTAVASRSWRCARGCC